ncbi:hypothetical protein [Thauera chlorobenzoica]|uniref:hypothetical protein n=1 Tax=Thauera chlorobenzoica TaxID=96773 RepID=UPI00089FC058|nr:hypothetical protein [Thauera chlorobenzoica]SEF71506.1 hypothetical protein SAMN05216242_104118 [Thauera chlorobenzoica]
MATLHITRQQYREFAELTKAAGMALNLSTYKRMGNCWGSYSPWGLLVCRDVTSSEPQWDERALITLSSTINADKLRAAGPSRPELDWSQLEDHELFPFIVWHEIGHRMDNFDHMGIMCMKDLDVRDECHKRVRVVNEVLADRFAWQKVRPGEPIPLSEKGQIAQEQIHEAIEYSNAHAPRLPGVVRPLSPCQYQDVPDYMLASHDRAAFVGPRVSPSLLHDRINYHRLYAERNGQTLY